MNSYYSADYQEAREKFLVASESAGAEVAGIQNPNKGPDGRALFTDIAVLGPKSAESILFLQSGTHGVEGFAGSAIQIALLNDPVLSQLSSRIRLVLIHAINPWGFAHVRRVNEDNVDLNRNFLDHSRSPPGNPAYQRLAAVLEPSRLPSYCKLTTLAKLLSYAAIHGRATLRSAVTEGQYSHPKGLFFGGRRDVWSNKVLRQVLTDYAVGAREVVFIDSHTGLGPAGHAAMILSKADGMPAVRRALDWWGSRVSVRMTTDLVGTVRSAVRAVLRESKVTAGTLEFGTLPSHAVLWALIAENWLYHYADRDDPRFPIIKAALRNAFFTDTDEWKLAVWSHGREVILQAFNGLISKSAN